eukprot:TRINITY_DN1369_c0_g1_i3.p1 TRINITY_DN1369_c0_g1~~TRINITY_DN1369_c0_g1_i3.p1  ORF type:complete len:919 (-),score=282.50 TRINITY_DN1369_c0_g1_i3:1036-3606(-)
MEDPSDLWKSLKDGLILVSVANKLMPGIIPKWNKRKTPTAKLHVLMERENIDLYLDACWKLGMESADMFITSDLHSKKGMNAVFNNIVALSRIAENYGITEPKPIGPPVNKKTGPPKWELAFASGPLHVGEIQFADESPEEVVMRLTKELQQATIRINTLENSNQALKDDIQVVREKLLLAKTQFIFDNNGQSDETTSVMDSQKFKEMEQQLQQSTGSLAMLKDELSQERARFNAATSQIQDLSRIVKSFQENGVSDVDAIDASTGTVPVERDFKFSDINEHVEDTEFRVWLFEQLKSITSQILSYNNNNEEEPFDNEDTIVELEKHIFPSDSGRRMVIYILNNHVEQNIGESSSDGLELPSSSFELVVRIINNVLTNMEFENHGSDFITSKYILYLSTVIYSLFEDSKKLYLHECLNECDTWDNPSFWEEYFWDRAAAEFPKLDDETDEMTVEQRSYIDNQIINCARAMYVWSKALSTSDDLEIFVGTVGETLNIDDEEIEMIQEKVKSILQESTDESEENQKTSRTSFVMIKPHVKDEFVSKIERDAKKIQEKKKFQHSNDVSDPQSPSPSPSSVPENTEVTDNTDTKEGESEQQIQQPTTETGKASQKNIEMYLDLVQEKSKLQAQIEYIQSKTDSYTSEIKDLKKKNDDLQQKISLGTGFLEDLKVKHEEEIKNLNEQLNAAESAKKILQKKLVAERKESLKSNLKDKEIEGEVSVLKSKLDELNNQLSKLSNEKQRLLNDNESNNQKILSLQSTIKEKDNLLSTLEEKDLIIEAAEQELQKQENKIQKLKEKCKQLEKGEGGVASDLLEEKGYFVVVVFVVVGLWLLLLLLLPFCFFSRLDTYYFFSFCCS